MMKHKRCLFAIGYVTAVVLLFCPGFSTGIYAEEVEVKASVNAEKIGIEDVLIYTVTFKGVSTPRPPDLSQMGDFEIAQRSHSTNFQNINGVWSHFINYNYYLTPRRLGTLTIPPLSFNFDGQDYKTQSFQIEVVKGSITPKQPTRQRMPSIFDDFDNDEDLFPQPLRPQDQEIDIQVIPEISKRQARKGEQLIYRVMLYTRTRAQLSMISNQSLPGFWQEWYPVPESFEPLPAPRVLNGKNYQVFEIRKVALFPNKTGDITIPSLKFQFVVPDNRLSVFSSSRPVYRSTTELTVQVSDLPPGARDLPVGKYSFNVQATKNQIDVNDILTLKIIVSGSGNIKTINVPEFTTNEYYKIYPAKVNRNVSLDDAGVSGTVEAEVPVSFKQTGLISFPPLEFNYYDANLPGGQVVKIASEPFTINVTGAKEKQEKASTIPQTEIVKKGEDIEFIKTGEIYHQENYFYDNRVFIFLVLVPFLLNLIYMLKVLVFDRFISQNPILKQRKLLNTTTRDLEHIKDYGEISPILEHYLKEKTGLGLSAINNQSIDSLLSGHSISDGDIKTFIQLKSRSESSRFSPEKPTTQSTTNLKQDIKTLIDILKRIDSRIKIK